MLACDFIGDIFFALLILFSGNWNLNKNWFSLKVKFKLLIIDWQRHNHADWNRKKQAPLDEYVLCEK